MAPHGSTRSTDLERLTGFGGNGVLPIAPDRPEQTSAEDSANDLRDPCSRVRAPHGFHTSPSRGKASGRGRAWAHVAGGHGRAGSHPQGAAQLRGRKKSIEANVSIPVRAVSSRVRQKSPTKAGAHLHACSVRRTPSVGAGATERRLTLVPILRFAEVQT